MRGTATAAVLVPPISRLSQTQDGMQNLEMPVGNKFAWNASWPNLNLWSSITLASLSAVKN